MPRRELFLFSVAQAAPSFVGGFYVPFFPLWLSQQGIAAAEISTLIACAMFVRVLVNPVVGIVADALGDRRAVAMACAAVSSLFFVLLGIAAPIWGFAAILPLMIVAVPLNSATGPIVEAVTARGAIDYGFDYARARLWGSLAFVVANYLAGLLIGATGRGAIVWAVAVTVAACVVAFWPMPPLKGETGQRRAIGKALQRTSAESRVLLKQPVFLLFLAAVSAAQASHVVFYTFGAITFRGLGYSDSYIGALWAVGTLAEVALFAAPSVTLRQARATTLIALGSALAAVRWFGMAYDVGPVGALLLQLGHAASFGLVHLGTMKFLGIAIPPRLAATGQSLFAVMAYGLAMGAVTLVAGQLYETIGQRTYLAMAVLSLLALGLTLLLARTWNMRSLFASARL
ncbi:MAG: MFS transporter [Alphaproteobacteria bacterium]|nr:MFS transporter [Alphaproteobacteria bacterium]